MNDPEKKFFSFDVRRMALGIFYFLLIGVVLYGMKDHVYDGFGSTVPWIIIVLFGLMGVMRIIESVTGRNVLEWLHENDDEQNHDADVSGEK